MTLYSHSRINCFENCPKAYWFSYIEKPEIELREGIEAFMGSRVHEALEKLYNELKLTKLNSLEELLSFYEKQWKENWNENIVIVKDGLKQKHYFDLGKKCIQNYYNKHKPFNKDKTIACEKRVKFALDDQGKHRMHGYIDRLAEENTGEYVIHDYKTSASLPIQDYLDQDRQLALYSIAVKKDFKDCNTVKLCWHYLAFDKDMQSNRTKEQLEELKKEMIELIQGIEKAEKENDFPAKKSMLCDWCQYTELCPLNKHATKLRKLSAKEFRKDEGVKLVNKYIELNGRLKEAETDLDSLKNNIFAYTNKFRLERIIGSEAALKITALKTFSFAGINEKQKEELKLILENEGLLDDFLQLDTRALGTAIQKSKIDKETEKELKKIGKEKETKTIRIVKK